MATQTPLSRRIRQNVLGFNYQAIDARHREKVKERTAEIHSLQARAAGDVIRIGKYLSEVRGLIEAGQWCAWLRSEFGWVPSTANTMIQAAKRFGDLDAACLARFQPSALIEIARDKVPDDVREEVIDLARAGQKVVTQDLVKSVLARHEARQSGPQTRPDAIHRLRSAIRHFLKNSPPADVRERIDAIVEEILAEAAADQADVAASARAVGALC